MLQKADLPTFVVGDVIFVTVVVQELYPLDTKLGLQRAWGVIDPSMDHSTVMSALVMS